MVDFFKGRYRVPSARCHKWDYRSEGAYFITICTAHRKNYFGEIDSGVMHLSDAGQIVHQNWLKIPEHFKFIALGSFVVMPNHFHGILIINSDSRLKIDNRKSDSASKQKTDPDENIPDKVSQIYSDISPKMGSVSVVIRSFKSSCTRDINMMYPGLLFNWQPRFHDHIIRDQQSFIRIRNYIENNPKRWQDDSFYRY